MLVKGGDFMIRVAVCDDIHEVVEHVTGYLMEYQQLKDQRLDITSLFTKAKQRLFIQGFLQ